MPAKSKKQFKLMAGVMSGSVKNSGTKQSAVEHFEHKTPSKKRKAFSKHLTEKGKKY